MSTEDFRFAIRLTDTVDWQLVEEDFQFMLKLEPEGCFVLLHNSERVGMLTTVSFGKTGWIGNVIVKENWRKKGAGSLLVKHAMHYLAKNNVGTIGLYAYMDTIAFYKRLGFMYDSDFIVLQGKGVWMSGKAAVREVKSEDLSRIVDLDKVCFGASRRKLLQPILNKSTNLCYVSVKDGEMLGYVAAKVYEGVAELGPLACLEQYSDEATDLLKTVLNRLKGFDLSTFVPKRQTMILDFLKKSGFVEKFPVARMFFGTPPLKKCIYLAESLERG